MRGTWQTTGGGGGGLALVVIVALVLIGSGAASAAASALASLVVTIAIVIGSVITLAVLGGVAWLIWRVRQDRPARLITERPVHQLAAARPVYQLPAEPRAELPAAASPAIEPGREVHLHLNVTPDQLAAIMRHYTEENS